MASFPLTFDDARPVLRHLGVAIAIANTSPRILWRRGTRVSPSLADIGDGSIREVKKCVRIFASPQKNSPCCDRAAIQPLRPPRRPDWNGWGGASRLGEA